MNKIFKILLIFSALYFMMQCEAVEHKRCTNKISDQAAIEKLALSEFKKNIKKQPKKILIERQRDNADEWVYLIESEDPGDQPGSNWLILIKKCNLQVKILNGY